MGSWTRSLLLSVAGALFFNTANAAVAAIDSTNVPRTYMVEFVKDYDVGSFYQQLGEEHIPATARLNLTYSLFKGASFELGEDLGQGSVPNRIAKLPGVKKIWPVHVGRIPEYGIGWVDGVGGSLGPTIQRRQDDETEDERIVEIKDIFSPHVMTQVDKLKEAGITGKGIKIGIVDTGVDYKHPALGGCFGEGCLVAYGRDYVGDYYDENSLKVPEPDDDPWDSCNGHGTHIAGIIAAQENPLGFTGVAPGVTLGAYRVSSCRGYVHSDIYVAGFNQAFEDGSDIITTSTQFTSEWSEDSVAVVCQRITEQGVPCIAPMGNTGLNGLFSTGSPAVGHGVAAIASVTNVDYPMVLKKATYTTEDGSEHPFGFKPGRFGEFKTISKDLWLLDDETTGDCTRLPDDTPDLSEYVVLATMEGCSIHDKASMIMDFRGRNLLAYSSNFTQVFNIITLYMNTSELIVYPLAVDGLGMVTQGQGKEWVERLQAGEKVTLHMTSVHSSQDIVYSPKNDLSHGYLGTTSSWGLGLELDIKPQFAAPGGNILSTYPMNKGNYTVMSGTSMASPFAAAVYALVAEVRGTTDPNKLRNVIASTANPNLWFDGKSLADTLAPVAQQGAGLIQAYNAAYVKTLVDTAGISFNDTDNFVKEANFTIENTSDEEVTYALSHVKAVTVYAYNEGSIQLAPFPNPTVDAAATLDFSEESVTLGAGESVTISVVPTPPQGVDPSRFAMYSGYIAINGTNGDNLSIPYIGLAASMRNVTIFDTSETNTFLQYWDVTNRLKPLPAGTTYTFPKPEGDPDSNPSRNVPYISSVFARPAGTASLSVFIEALDEDSPLETTEFMGSKVVGLVPGYPQEFVPHGKAEIAFTGMLADGTVVPDGNYRFVFKALKILGNREKPSDWETITVGPFTLKYGEATLAPVEPFPLPIDFD
ncbi:hypothetical protein jhhlp_001604 [Lomentospora prolificans]|uniref:Peptidase S8/S53 domain-containing protein n=1 Tax=Lomentospora prolificans TaxID=41688 RepID=A0A2N3NIP8_9PEZI|nr:hypothetical protein jhhlp_001604 [Lomentospora prolificans]